MTDAELEELIEGQISELEGAAADQADYPERPEYWTALQAARQALISTIRELREENAQTKLGYDADIKALCEALWKREPGCEFVQLNYPQIAAELEEQS